MVPFAGWEMPLQFTSILAEVEAVRSRAGIFDVSHMGRVEVAGRDAVTFLQRLLTADVPGMALGRARYTLLCNQQGGIIDDTILYRLEEERFLLVPNAANVETVLAWLQGWLEEWRSHVTLRALTGETAMIALQGPLAEEVLRPVCSLELSSLGTFRCAQGRVSGVPATLSRTGYTGEDGFEMVLPSGDAPQVWLSLVERGATPCGLGARDVLRVEAGLALHGADIGPTITPLEAGLERFVSWSKGEFMGSQALLELKGRGLPRALVGFRMRGRGIPRAGYPILDDHGAIGEVTSGTYSPSLDTGIGLGYVSLERASPGVLIAVDVRGRREEAEVVALPFYSRKRPNASR